jgi:hypothetical protein
MYRRLAVTILTIFSASLLAGCAAMTQPIDVTPALIDALAKDQKSACVVNQINANSIMYGGGNATSTFCRLGADSGTATVSRDGVITITHGQTVPLPSLMLVPAPTPAPGR